MSLRRIKPGLYIASTGHTVERREVPVTPGFDLSNPVNNFYDGRFIEWVVCNKEETSWLPGVVVVKARTLAEAEKLLTRLLADNEFEMKKRLREIADHESS